MATIESCLKSIYEQTFKSYEVCIIDGMSTDGTIKFIESFCAKDPRFKWISEKDAGVYDAMNKGISISKGEYVYFLGSDDLLYNQRVLQYVYEALEKQNFPDFVYGNVLLGNSNYLHNGEYDICKLYDTNICHQALFYKRKVFNVIGKYDLSFPALSDWHFNLKCFLNKTISKKYIPVLIAVYALEGFSTRFKDPFHEQKDAIIKSLVINAERDQYHLIRRYMINPQTIKGKVAYLSHHLVYHIQLLKRKLTNKK